MVNPVFLDTSVLLPALVECGAPNDGARRIMVALADGKLRNVHTAWHCCLEFLAVVTRLPGELRLNVTDALQLLEEDVLTKLRVHQLPDGDRSAFLRGLEAERVSGGRIYDAHIAAIARSCGARIVVTENRRHFESVVHAQVSVMTADQFAADAGC